MKASFEKTSLPKTSWAVGLRLAFFLAFRQIKKSSAWTTGLIIAIMTLTFLNLTVISGILIGLVEGSSRAYRSQYSGDVLIENLPRQRFIEKSRDLEAVLQADGRVLAFTSRRLEGVRLEAKAQRLKKGETPERVAATLAGIDPQKEDSVTAISKRVVAGRYLAPDDQGVLVGDGLLAAYARGVPGDEVLRDVDVGSLVRLVFSDGSLFEVPVLGVVTSKINEVNRRIYMPQRLAQRLIDSSNLNSTEISVLLRSGVSPEEVVADLEQAGYDEGALLQTWEQSQGSFFKDISTTFNVLGNVIGAIALTVSSVTVFIVIFIGAVTRRKYIGIMKAVGVGSGVIEASYVCISVFYALVGSSFGFLLLMFLIRPYFDANPIDFPFSDGVLVASLETTLARAGLLGLATVLAGYLPARMIVKQPTLDALLNR